jgi:hypothetical protein
MGREDRGKSRDVDKKAPGISNSAFHIFATTGWKQVRPSRLATLAPQDEDRWLLDAMSALYGKATLAPQDEDRWLPPPSS